MFRIQHFGGQVSYACARGRAVLGQLDEKTRLERWRDNHAWASMQRSSGQEEHHKSGEMVWRWHEIWAEVGSRARDMRKDEGVTRRR